MYARLDDRAAGRANMCKEHALKLRVMQHKYAFQIAAHVRALECHERKLQHLTPRSKPRPLPLQEPTLPAITPLD
jgi:hypothetical protein